MVFPSPLKSHGFITNWLTCGPLYESFKVNLPKTDQLNYEKQLRSLVVSDPLESIPQEIVLNQEGLNDAVWKYHHGMENWFVDFSKFCQTLQRIELYAACCIHVDEESMISARLYTFCGVELWLNNQLQSVSTRPVYKPMQKLDLSLNLRKGRNTLFVRLQNLGVRDTRTLFGIELRDYPLSLKISTPDFERVYPHAQLGAWLESVIYDNGSLKAVQSSPQNVEVRVDGQSMGWYHGLSFTLPTNAKTVELLAEKGFQPLRRLFEISKNFHPQFQDLQPLNNHKQSIFQVIAHTLSTKTIHISFDIYAVLAKSALDSLTPSDEESVIMNLSAVDNRADCSDFLVIGLLRLLKTTSISNTLKERIRDSLLNWRYWMDEAGDDGMCFWSENHAIMFYGSQLVAGALFPKDHFSASKRSGAEQFELGVLRCNQWLDEIEKEGFEEFLSGGYVVITAVGLLNLIDFGPSDISLRAKALLDTLLIQVSLHTFRGVVIGPQGRTYREVLRPHTQNVQSLIYYFNPHAPVHNSWWIAAFASTRYTPPNNLIEIMNKDYVGSYVSSKAEIFLLKTKNYILTSVASPSSSYKHKQISLPEQWQPDIQTYTDIKQLNDKYHGTTILQPGIYGYQQHLWYAALDSNCVVFCNHPGDSHEFSSLRPGYWYGNGVLPMLEQRGNRLGVIYQLIDSHPVDFTHLYWPSSLFTELVRDGKWLFGRKNDSYIGVWCSSEMVKHNEVLTDCEFRAYDSKVGYVCYCSSIEEDGSFEAFRENMKRLTPQFDREHMELVLDQEFKLTYSTYINTTQVIL